MTLAVTPSPAAAALSPLRAAAEARRLMAASAMPASSLAADVRASLKDARASVKAQAKQRVHQLREQMKLLQKLLAGNPKELARQVARIAKELRAVLKDFGGAHEGDVQDAALGGDTAAKPSETPLQARQRAAGLEETPEAQEMKAFVTEVRGLLKKLTDLLREAKIQPGAAKDKNERRDPFDDAQDELGNLRNDLDRAFRDASGEAKVFDAPANAAAPGGLVSVKV